MSLIEEFREIGFEMAQILKAEIEKTKDTIRKAIDALEKDTKQKIHHDLELLEQNMIHQAEYRLNKELSDRINQINQDILERKNQILEDLIDKSEVRIKERIDRNPDAYLDFLISSLKNHANLLNTDCWLYLTVRDRKIFTSKPEFMKQFPKFTLHEDCISDFAGYKIIAKNGLFEMDFTFQTLKYKNRAEISQCVMNRFPIFEVKLEDAIEIFDHLKENAQKGDN